MRNFIFGGIGVVLGLALFIADLTASTTPTQATAAYRAGAESRIPIAILLLLAGLWAIRKGLRARRPF